MNALCVVHRPPPGKVSGDVSTTTPTPAHARSEFGERWWPGEEGMQERKTPKGQVKRRHVKRRHVKVQRKSVQVRR